MTYPTSTRSLNTQYTLCEQNTRERLLAGIARIEYAVLTQGKRILCAPNPTVEVGMGSAGIVGVSLREPLGSRRGSNACHQRKSPAGPAGLGWVLRVIGVKNRIYL